MPASLHIPTLAHRIAEYIRAEQLPPGSRLSGRKLAARFRVSRSPIERALQLLEQQMRQVQQHLERLEARLKALDARVGGPEIENLPAPTTAGPGPGPSTS